MKWPENDALIERALPNGPFLIFFIKPEPLTKVLIPTVQKQGHDFGMRQPPV